MQEPPTAATPEPAPPAPSNKSALLIVFLVVFIDLLGFGIVLPLLPRFSDDLLVQLDIPGGKNSPLGGLILGLLMSSFSFMQFLFAPLWGRISDRVGRRPILLLGLASSALFYTLFGIALTLAPSDPGLALTLIFVSRIGAGVAGATIGTAQAVIADATPPEHRKHGMALIGAAFGIGFTFGPLLGFAALTWMKPILGATGYVAAGLSLLAFLLGLRLLPETLPPGRPPEERMWLNWTGLRNILRTPTVGLLVLIFFLVTFGFGSFESTLALLNKDILVIDDDDNFLVFAYVGFILLLTQGFLYRRLAKRLSEVTFMKLGIAFMGVGVGSLGLVSFLAYGPSAPAWLGSVLWPWYLSTLALAVVGFAFLTPSLQALISRRSDPHKQGEVLGVNQSAAAMARILGPVVGLSLYKLHPSHLLPYALGAALVLLMLPLVPRLRRE